MKNKLILAGIVSVALRATVSAQEPVPPHKGNPEPAQTEQQHDSVYYSCVMHKDVAADKPGTCYKCNMPLEKRVIARARPKNPKMEGVKTYTCLTHPDVKSDKPGKCSRCGLDLVIDEKVK